MTALVIQARAQDSLGVTIAAGAGENVFELEFNRSSDFASDESLFRTGLAAGVVATAGLPAGTPFYMRSRATNGAAPGPWSNVVLAATLPPAAVAPYVGFSIEPAILVVPEAIDYIASAQEEAGAPAANLLGDDPMSTMRSQSAAPAIVFHTAGRPQDVISLMGTMLGEAATWRIRAADTEAGLTAAPPVDTGILPFRASANLGWRPSYHSYRRLPAPVAREWWRIDITNPGPTFVARNLVTGLARQSVNYSRGAGQTPYDLGTMQRTPFGTPDRTPGWRGRSLDFGLSWLSEAEYEAKWSDLDQLVATTDPVFVLPNTKANAYLHDRIGFGTIENMRAENVRSSKYARSLEIRSIY